MKIAFAHLLLVIASVSHGQSSVPDLKYSADKGRQHMGLGSNVPMLIREGRISVNGTELYVKEIGAGDLVVVVHGGPGLGFNYLLPHLQGLAMHNRLLYYDQRATGRSSLDLTPEQVTLAAFVEDIEALRVENGSERIHLLAHSFGALIAVQYAATYPDHVSSLVLVSPTPLSTAIGQKAAGNATPQFSEIDDLRRKELLASDAFLVRDAATVEEVLHLGFKYTFHDTSKAQLLELDLHPDLRETHRLLNGLSSDLSDHDLHPELAHIKAPVLVVLGDSDAMGALAGTAIQSAKPDALIRTLEDAGHFPFIEKRLEFEHMVEEFLRNSSQR